MIWFIFFFFSFCNCEFSTYGNVSYQNAVIYDIVNPKNVHLKLTSITGDADLYIFTLGKLDKTNINFSEYQFKSDTFGDDVITIDMDNTVPLAIVVLGVAQGDSEYALEIVRLKPKELDYQAIDDVLQKSPGSSYTDLQLQHSFDPDLFYAQLDNENGLKSRIEDESQKSAPSLPLEKPPLNRDHDDRRQHRKQSKKRRSVTEEEGSSFNRLLITLLEVIAHIVL